MGDAINWEWIVACAKKSGRSVIVVSRDGDYGLKFDDTSYINEWLRHEFSERVKNKSHISLTVSLSDALEEIRVHVTQAEREAEKKLIETVKQEDSSRGWTVRAYQEGISFQEAIEAVRRAQNEALRQAADEPSKAALNEAIRTIQRAASAPPTDIDQGSKGNQSKE